MLFLCFCAVLTVIILFMMFFVSLSSLGGYSLSVTELHNGYIEVLVST
uniref:Uncharacterized protein n=1 Tax=Anguilla anguilla TaxID=7936 RepID=A0A0E9R8A1_ANGAN